MEWVRNPLLNFVWRKLIFMKNTGSKNVASTVRELVTPTAEDMGYSVWDVEFVREGADKYLRITIDNEEGITIDDCEKFHRAIDPILDEADPISEAYILEVSSPGIERELKCDEHISVCIGWDVEVRLYKPRDGAKRFIGVLLGLNDEGDIVISQNDAEMTFKKSDVAKLSTYYDFDM